MSATTTVSDHLAMINSQAKMYNKCIGYKIDKDEALIACKHCYTYSLLKEAEQGKSSLSGASEMTALGQIKDVWNDYGGDPRGDQNLKVWMFWGDFELYYKIFSNKPTMHHLSEAWQLYKEEKRNGTWN
jgi:hypothetical protein